MEQVQTIPNSIRDIWGSDARYIQRFLCIRDKVGRIVPFFFNRTQVAYRRMKGMELARRRERDRNAKPHYLVLKYRQGGITTEEQAESFYLTATRENQSLVTLAHDKASTVEIFRMVNLFDRKLTPEVRPVRDYENKAEIEYKELNSKFHIGTAGNRTFGRGMTLQRAHGSEIGLWGRTKTGYSMNVQDIANLIAGLCEACPYGPVVLEGTAQGAKGWFYETWNEAKKGGNDWIPVFLPWFIEPMNSFPFEIGEEIILTEEEKNFVEMVAGKYGMAIRPEQIKWRRAKQNSLKGLFQQEHPECFTADTKISFPDTNGLDVYRNKPECCKGENDVFRIETGLGYAVKATENHQFMLSDGSWCQLKCLKQNDSIKLLPPRLDGEYQYVSLTYDLPILNSRIKIDEELAEFIGVFMGDGSFYKDKKGNYYNLSIVFDRQDADVIRKYKNYLIKVFGKVNERLTGSKDGGIELRVSSKWLDVLFVSLDLVRRTTPSGLKSSGIKRKVHVPDYILRSPKSVIASFSRGLFDADGFIGYRYPQVKFFTKYEDFMRDIQLLLLGFGITGKVNAVVKKHTDGHNYVGRELCLRKSETEAYMKEIGFISKRKNNRWINRIPLHRGGWKGHGIVFIDKIKEIKYIGKELVFDREVIPEHYYSANGFYVHNSDVTAFLVSGQHYFDISIINKLVELCKSPIEVRDDGCLTVWARPVEGHRYIIGGDVGEGLPNSDFSVGGVLDYETCEQVACLRGRWKPEVFGEKMAKLGYEYNTALLAPEANNHGHSTLNTLLNAIHYPRLYYHRDYDTTSQSTKLGWQTNAKTRPTMLSGIKMAVEDNLMKVNCPIFLSECRNFQDSGEGKYEGDHDDTVIAWAICWSVRQIGFGPEPRVSMI